MENTDLYIDEKGTLAEPLVDADSGKRFLNLIIDIGVIIVLIVIFNKIIYHHSIFSYLGMFKILDIAVVFAYFYGLENSLGQTVGKMITKTKVVNLDGGKPTTQQMLVRTFSRAIPLEPVLIIGGKWLHDSLSQTRVVKI